MTVMGPIRQAQHLSTQVYFDLSIFQIHPMTLPTETNESRMKTPWKISFQIFFNILSDYIHTADHKKSGF